MITKSMSSTLIGDEYRFSDKIMLKQEAGAPTPESAGNEL
jgi:hypothetical protein